MVNSIINEKINRENISEWAERALMYEVSVSPKPGLVSRFSNGSHSDMDFYTFVNSAISLRNYFIECYDYGQEYSLENKNFLNNLRYLGMRAEEKMYSATIGINTHKGTIFSMGILIAIISSYFKEYKKIDLLEISKNIKNICKDLNKELLVSENKTNGEKIYKKYGLTGARGLAVSGYDIVLLDGIEKFKISLEKYNFEISCILTLLYYMSILNDTNIVNRRDIQTLNYVKNISKERFEKYYSNIFSEEEIKKDISLLNEEFIEKNISPGGSADLLIMTIFIYFLQK